MDIFEEITIGALLHDIGKVKQRAAANPKAKRHQEWGAEWLEENGLAQFKDFSLYHHRLKRDDYKKDELSIDRGDQNYRDDLWFVAIADNLSASERISHDEKVEEWDQQVPLTSIFSTLSLDGSSKKSEPYAFPTVLIEEFPFPQQYKPSSESTLFTSRQAYQRILSEIESQIRDLRANRQISSHDLLTIFERTLTFVPSETSIDPEDPSKNPDVSLFDHLKTTAAIAGALWRYFEESKGAKDPSDTKPEDVVDMSDDEKPFLLVVGDISGIQHFIYNIPQEKALRGLRGRSFFVEFLGERIATRIIEELGLSRASIIYRGGGNFRLLCQNSHGAKQKIAELRDKVNKWLLEKTGGILSCSIAWVEMSKASLSIRDATEGSSQQEDQHKLLREAIESEIKRQKYQKFAPQLTAAFFEPQAAAIGCSVCGASQTIGNPPQDHPERLCSFCFSLYNTGGKLPRTKFIYKVSGSGDFEVCEEPFELSDQPPAFSEVCYVLDDYPRWKQLPQGLNALPLFVGSYIPQEDEGQNKSDQEPLLHTLDGMAEASIGKELLGTLRMDVDNLGKLFYYGMKRRSFSREATFSRLLEVFFKRYVPRIASGELLNGDLKRPMAVNPTYPRANKAHNAVVVYAGGDDLFITGSWSDVIELAYQIRAAFKKFTQNPDVTISGCLTINKPKEPIRRIAETAKEGLELAKTNKAQNGKPKNSFALFYSPSWKPESSAILFPSKHRAPLLDWDTFEEILNTTFKSILELGEFSQDRFNSTIPRGLLTKLITMARQLRSMGETYPHRLIYALTRGLGKEVDTDKKTTKAARLGLIRDLQNLERLRQMEVFLIWLDLLLRRG